jgi:hypothetical protein
MTLLGLAIAAAPAAAATGPVRFNGPIFVDPVKAGGEPLVIHSTKAGDLVYTSHEGTTHIDREGLPGTSIVQFLCPGVVTADCYKNHVWIWTSDDKGKTWQAVDEPIDYTGFSDPDLTEDAAGNIYNTGIDLINETVFMSADGGKSWPHGTPNCHQGDRPWLAGGVAGEVFMGTDDQVSSDHRVFHSTNIDNGCGDAISPSSGIPDNGTLADGGSWSAFGKLLYDRHDGSIIEPAIFNHKDGSRGVGYSRLANAAAAFASPATATFTPHEVMNHTSVFSPFGAPNVLSMDSAENLYFAWDTDERNPNGRNGCGNTPGQAGGPTPLQNHIMFAAGKHTGAGAWTFSTPVALNTQPNAHVQWPWSVAGSDGNVSVVWYQMDKLVDPDCDIDASTGQKPSPDVKTYIYEAHITGATSPALFHSSVVNAADRFIHQGGLCNSGTTCVATGQDRRLGDFFTNSMDDHGCVMIASGDTTTPDPITGGLRATSLPIFLRQTSGPSLTGQDCAVVNAATTTAPAVPANTTGGSAGTPNTAAAGFGRASLAALLAALAMLSLGLGVMRGRRQG